MDSLLLETLVAKDIRRDPPSRFDRSSFCVYRFPHRTYDSIEDGGSRLLEAGEVAGDYSANWMGEAEIEDYMWSPRHCVHGLQ